MQAKWAAVYMSLAEKLMAAGMRRLGNLRDESPSRALQRLREGARLAKTARLEASKGERVTRTLTLTLTLGLERGA